MEILQFVMITYTLSGIIVGVFLGSRTRSMPRSDYPFWRILSKFAWAIWLLGYVVCGSIMLLMFAISKSAPTPQSPLIGLIYFIASLVYILTWACTPLWFVAWFQARKGIRWTRS